MGHAGPGVDDELAVEVGRHLDPDLLTGRDQPLQPLLHVPLRARVRGRGAVHRLLLAVDLPGCRCSLAE